MHRTVLRGRVLAAASVSRLGGVAHRSAPVFLHLRAQVRQYTREGDGDNPAPGENKSWVPVEDASLQKVTRQALVHELMQVQMSTANQVVPWFLNQMPSSYFRQIPEEVRVKHLQAICALQDTGNNTNIILKSDNPDGRREMTFIRSGNFTGQLREMISLLPRDFGPLSRVKVFTSSDESLVLNVFTADSKADDALESSAQDREAILKYAAEVQAGQYQGDPRHAAPSPRLEPGPLNAYIDLCTRFHVATSNPRRFVRIKQLYDKIAGSENCAVDVEAYEPDTSAKDSRFWVSLAQTNVLPRVGLDKCLKLFKLHNLDVLRCHMDRVNDPGNGQVCLLRMLVQLHDTDQEPWPLDGTEWTTLKHELRRIKWLDDATIDRKCVAPIWPAPLPFFDSARRGRPSSGQAFLYNRTTISVIFIANQMIASLIRPLISCHHQVSGSRIRPRRDNRRPRAHAARGPRQAESVGLLQGQHFHQALGPAYRRTRCKDCGFVCREI